MKPILRDICRHIGLEHVASLPKKGFGMPAEFLNISKDQLIQRAGVALKKLDTNPVVTSRIQISGKKLAPFAGNNMNALWGTIVRRMVGIHQKGEVCGLKRRFSLLETE